VTQETTATHTVGTVSGFKVAGASSVSWSRSGTDSITTKSYMATPNVVNKALQNKLRYRLYVKECTIAPDFKDTYYFEWRPETMLDLAVEPSPNVSGSFPWQCEKHRKGLVKKTSGTATTNGSGVDLTLGYEGVSYHTSVSSQFGWTNSAEAEYKISKPTLICSSKSGVGWVDAPEISLASKY
jgi:hypothetical protein